MNVNYNLFSFIFSILFLLLFVHYFSFVFLLDFIKRDNDLFLYFLRNNDHFLIFPKILVYPQNLQIIHGTYLLIISLITYNVSKSKIFTLVVVVLVLNNNLLYAIKFWNLIQLITLSLVVLFFNKIKSNPILIFNNIYFLIIAIIFFLFIFYNFSSTLNESGLNHVNNFFEKTNDKYLLIFKTYFNIILFLSVLSITLFMQLKNIHPLFLTTLIFFVLFYCQSIILTAIGKEFNIYTCLPLIIILASLCSFSISQYLMRQKLYYFDQALGLLVLVAVFYNVFISLNQISSGNIETKIKSNEVFQAYNFLKQENLLFKYKEPLICSGLYSVVPKSFSTNVLKSRSLTEFDLKIKNKKCEFVILDWSTPGIYIWFKDKPDNLIIPSHFNYSDGHIEDLGIKKTQQLVQYLLFDIGSGYEVTFYNSLVLILNKK
jgi:hypothetical protein